jgi:glycosyltransferase involved in cell wall biosynthesis
MPLALLEGMACARPFVGMGVGGVLEIVETGTTGLLSAPGDCEGLGHALLKLLASPEMAQEMGRAARAHVEKAFSLKTTAAQTAVLFRRLVQPQFTSPRPRPTVPNHNNLITLNSRMEKQT